MFKSDTRVLVVDDFPTMRKIIKTLLKQLCFDDVDEAENGLDALNKLRQGKYDLVVCDWNMPHMEGIDLLRQIRSEEGDLRNIAFVMITAEAERAKIVEAIKAGVDNYIIKPFTAEGLKEKLLAVSRRKGCVSHA